MAERDPDVEGNSLSALIGNEIAQAQTFDQTKRTLAIEYMRGEMNDVPARTNGSSQTSRDVADTIQGMLPMIVRVFAASDQMVNYEATQPGGEQGAEEASELMNYGLLFTFTNLAVVSQCCTDREQLLTLAVELVTRH